MGVEKEMVGIIRGCIKTITCGKKFIGSGNILTMKEDDDDDHSHPKVITSTPICTKLAYILGLRVSPSHRYVHTISIASFLKTKQKTKKNKKNKKQNQTKREHY